MDSRQGHVELRPWRYQLPRDDEDSEAGQDSGEDDQRVHQPPPAGRWSDSPGCRVAPARKRPGPGIVPSLCNQDRPAPYRTATNARTAWPASVPQGAEYDP